jgi:hypothetical protein
VHELEVDPVPMAGDLVALDRDVRGRPQVNSVA